MLEQVVKEAANKKVVVLFGAKVVELFCEDKVSTISGLSWKSKYFSTIAFPCVSPGIVFKNSVGELRFALRELSNLIRELGINTPDHKKIMTQIIEERVEDW
jgi:hypothetical protein